VGIRLISHVPFSFGRISARFVFKRNLGGIRFFSFSAL